MDLFSSLVYKDIQVHTHTHTHIFTQKNATFFKLTAIFLLITNEILSVDLLAVQFIKRFLII